MQPEVASSHFVPNHVQNLVGGGVLAHELQLMFAVRGDEGDDVGVGAEARAGGAEGIGADHVAVFGGQLLPGVFDDVIGLHGEAAEELVLPLMGTEIFQNILGPLEFDKELAVLLFHLGVRDGGRGVVGDGGGLDDDVHFRSPVGDGVEHVLGGLDGYDLDEHGGRCLHVGGHQGDLSAPEHGGLGQGNTHLAGGMIGDEAHRVDGFPGGACGDQDLLSGQILLIGHFLENVGQQCLGLRHFSGTDVTAGEISAGGLDHLIAEALQLLQVVLDDGIEEHLGVHGGGDDLMAGAGHDSGGQHVVGQTVGNLADDVGGGRGDEHHICPFSKGNVLDAVLEVSVEGIHQALVAGEGLEGDGIDKIGGVGGHQHLHICVELLQHGGKGSDFIVCNGAGVGQDDGLVL